METVKTETEHSKNFQGESMFHKRVFSAIGKTRFYQEHIPECVFPKKWGG